ncbi:MAG: calcium/sodium antiporter [Puniceicoccaceae bacterium]
MKVVAEFLGLSYGFEGLAGWMLAGLMVIGLVLLMLGGDWLTRGSSGIALRFKVSSVVVGLTIVSAATSMPELVTSLIGVLAGSPDLATGNVVGSNAANIGLILGSAALIASIKVHRRLLKREMPMMLVATFVFYLLAALGGGIGRLDGLLLLAGIVAVNFFLLRAAKRGEIEVEVVETVGTSKLGILVLWVVLGGVALMVGAEILVDSSVVAARRIGITEGLIGLTVLAVGTSLPELGATLAAVRRGETGIVIGNIVGSNLFNIGLIIGVVGLVQPFPVPASMLRVEFPGMLILTVLVGIMMYSGKVFSRREGLILMVLYGGYIALAAIFQ